MAYVNSYDFLLNLSHWCMEKSKCFNFYPIMCAEPELLKLEKHLTPSWNMGYPSFLCLCDWLNSRGWPHPPPFWQDQISLSASVGPLILLLLTAVTQRDGSIPEPNINIHIVQTSKWMIARMQKLPQFLKEWGTWPQHNAWKLLIN